MIDTGIEDLESKFIGRAFIDLIPEGTLVIPLMREKKELLNARRESFYDKNFTIRLQLYKRLIDRCKLVELQNDSSIENLLSRVNEKVFAAK
jgi:hypothetical protein